MSKTWRKIAGLLSVVALIITAVGFSTSGNFSASAASWIDQAFGNIGVKKRSRYRQRDVGRQGYAIGRIDQQLTSVSSLSSKSKKRRLYRIPNASKGLYVRSGRGYRTMCVRTCDGFFFPVSFSTSKNHLKKDEDVCKSSCGAPARLYYYPNPGGEIEDMVSYRGNKKYKKLKYAFLYKKEFVASCRCQPEPWTKAARQKHKIYASIERGEHKKLALLKKSAKKKRVARKRSKNRRIKRRYRRSSTKKVRTKIRTVALKRTVRRKLATRKPTTRRVIIRRPATRRPATRRGVKRTYRVRRVRRARPTRRWTF